MGLLQRRAWIGIGVARWWERELACTWQFDAKKFNFGAKDAASGCGLVVLDPSLIFLLVFLLVQT